MKNETLQGRRFGSTAFLLLVCFLGLGACVSWVQAGDAGLAEVLVYYANETAPDEVEGASWDTILQWLDSSEDAKAREIAGQLRRDRAEFHQAVDRQIADLEGILAMPAGAPAAVVFSNRLVREGKYLVFRPGAGVVEEGAIEPLPAEDPVLVSNPLARVEMLERYLEEVARRFPTDEHRFILNTQSHGNVKMAMVPRLIVRADLTTREELLEVATGAAGDDYTPSWDRPIGVTKDDYFTVLGRMGEELGMEFSLVFMESCSGVLDETHVRVPPNVHRLYMTGSEKTEYQNIDYGELLGRYDGSVPFSELAGDALAEKFPTLVRGDEGLIWGLPWHVVLWWIPLVLWVVWAIARRRRKVG